MDNNQISDALSRTSLNAMLQDALDILEADDGKSFEEKRDAVISQLKQKDDSELARLLAERAIADKAGAGTKDAFWKCGRIIRVNNTAIGNLKRIDEIERVLILTDGCKIPLDDVVDIESNLLRDMF